MRRAFTSSQKLPVLAGLSALVVAGIFSPVVHGGSYVYGEFAPDTRTFPAGYTGTGGPVNLNVCVVPGTPNAADIEQAIKNNIAHWNKLQATSSNLRDMELPTVCSTGRRCRFLVWLEPGRYAISVSGGLG